MNAVVDALRDYGVRHVEMPATPQKIWGIVNAHRLAAE
jgi:carbon-monoxide dehydrogenase large subunit